MNVEQALVQLSRKRPVFHNEADFRHALAWELQKMYPDATVRLEYKPRGVKARVYLDIWLSKGSKNVAIEVKYRTRALEVIQSGEEFLLTDQEAQESGRYDVLKDVMRLEHVVQKEPDTVGYVVFVTNDPDYWSPAAKESPDSAFRLQQGRELKGELTWSASVPPSEIKGREKPIKLRGAYSALWETFSQTDHEQGEFRALCLRVTAPKQLDVDSLLEQLAARRPVFRSQADLRDELAGALKKLGFRCATGTALVGDMKVDVYAQSDEYGAYAFEVRYPTAQLSTVTKDGAKYDLKAHEAQDLSRYDFVRDIHKLERTVAQSFGSSQKSASFVIISAYPVTPEDWATVRSSL